MVSSMDLAPAPTDSTLTSEQTDFVAGYVRGGGVLDYHDIIGLNAYKEIGSEWDLARQSNSLENVGQFAHFMMGALAEQIGDAQLGREYNYGNPRNFRKLVKIWQAVRQSVADETGNPESMPAFQYQGLNNSDLGDQPISEFLYFGSRVQTDPRFVERVRMYINPTPEATPLVAMGISAIFGEQFGRLPDGKFQEDSTARGPSTRNDRLLLWLHSPEELTVAVQAMELMSRKRPGDFADRQPLMMGSPVVVEGRELPTVRLAQEPSTLMNEQFDGPQSFNGSRVSFLSGVIHKLNEAGYANSPYLRREVADLVEYMAPEWGINPANFAFNADQDLAVIHRAIADAA